jgi:hypothetical protein
MGAAAENLVIWNKAMGIENTKKAERAVVVHFEANSGAGCRLPGSMAKFLVLD